MKKPDKRQRVCAVVDAPGRTGSPWVWMTSRGSIPGIVRATRTRHPGARLVGIMTPKEARFPMGSTCSRGMIRSCPVCGRFHVPGSPCSDLRQKGSPQSTTHGRQAVKRHFGLPVA